VSEIGWRSYEDPAPSMSGQSSPQLGPRSSRMLVERLGMATGFAALIWCSVAEAEAEVFCWLKAPKAAISSPWLLSPQLEQIREVRVVAMPQSLATGQSVLLATCLVATEEIRTHVELSRLFNARTGGAPAFQD
jgi:hypothetical protein